MSRYVEHDKRRERILKESVIVFMEDGYQGATYQKIAKRCGVSRTTLYQYFQSKQQIFHYAVKQVTDLLAEGFLPILRNKEMSALDQLEAILCHVIDECYENKRILLILFDYLRWLAKEGDNPRERVRRRTIRLRLTFVRLLNRAVALGELSSVDAGTVADLCFSQLEAGLVRMVLGYADEPETTKRLIGNLTGLLRNQGS